MKPHLPPVVLFRQHALHENGWSDHYGALHAAAAYAGLRMPARYFLKAIWQHGCVPPWAEVTPGVLFFNSPQADRYPLFVARKEEAAYLAENSYSNVRAIGLPILYAPPSGLPRQPGSLLVLPTHTLTSTKCENRRAFERYADQIAALRSRFSQITICVHPNCEKNGFWIKEFTDRKFEVVLGAQTNDLNALSRMRALFEQFETVTTNGWGSHVAYALAFGAKVAVHGEEIKISEAEALKDTTWAASPETWKKIQSNEVQVGKEEFLQGLKCSPTEAVENVALGRWLIGAEQMIGPDGMRELLTQCVEPSPTRTEGSLAVSTGFSRPRRILFVLHEATRTGAPMVVLHFLRWLRRESDLQFEVLLGRGGPLEEEFAKVAVIHQASEVAQVASSLRGFDLIYANTCANGELLEVLGSSGVRVITHLHELECGYEWTGARKMALCIRQTTHFIACAKAVAERFQTRFGVPAEKLAVSYEMIDVRQVAAAAAAGNVAELRARHGLPEDAFVVMGCGTVDLRKGVDLFAQAARKFKTLVEGRRPLRFVWAGAFNSPDVRIVLEHDLRKLGLEDEVRLVGEIANPHALLGLCDVFWMTSREDPFPLAMLEAAALGKPVICFDGAGGGREFCDFGGGIAVPYLDIAAMAETTRELLDDADRRAAVGGRAAGLVAERFSVEAIAPGLLRAIEAVLERELIPADVAQRSRPLAEIYKQWPPQHAPQRTYVAAHVARNELRVQAQAFVAKGKPREAVQLLVKAVSADLTSSDPLILCEGLVQIGEDLKAFDAKQAAVLLDRAASIARSVNLNLEVFRTKAA